MKYALISLALLAAGPAWAQAPAASPADAAQAVAATPYSVTTTKISTLLDTPALLVVFKKHLPDIVSNPQVELGRDLTLPEIVQYAPEIVTPEKLAAMDADLKALPQQ